VIFESRAQGLAGIVDGKFQVIVLRMVVHLFEDHDRDCGIGPGRGNDGFEAYLRMLIVDQTNEMGISAWKALRPVTEKMRCGGPGMIVWMSGDSFEEFRIDPATLLMEPKSFSYVVCMVRVRGVE
tara:strand:- start:10 stop:384 length:375 start_codon:yes stop_codon:yes gene_type:complete